MSRTDHHAPAWVRTRNDHSAYERHFGGCTGDDADCGVTHPSRDGSTCYRWDRDHHGTWDLRPTNEMVRLDCHTRERAYVRDALRAALRDYNAHGETDIEPQRRQRGQATFSGYWFH